MINRMNRVGSRVEEDTSILASAVRYDADQIRSDEEKAQARANIGAISAAQLADTKADLEEQIENISGISDPEAVSQMVEDVAKHEEDISALKSNISSTTRNLFNVRDVQIGKAQNTSINANRATNFIPVKPSTQYVVSFNTIAGFEGVYWYQKTSADTTASITSGTISDGVVITTSADCAVLAIQFNKTPVTEADFEGIKFQVEEGKLKTNYIPNETAIDFVARENSDELDAFIETTRNLFSNLIIGRAANTSSNASRATAYIPVQGGSKYTISYEDKSAFDAVYWYQKADVTSTTSIAEGIVTDKLVLTMNASTNYLAIQFNKTNVSAADVEQMKIQVELGDTASEYVPHKTAVDYVARNKEMSLGTNCNYIGSKSISTFNKIMCVGDSLTAGVFNHNDSGTTQFETYAKYSYPTYLSKLTGVDVVNMGIGGSTSDVWYNTNQNTDLSGYDCAIIQLGVNDAIQYEGWTQTSITAFTNIINKIKTDNNNVFIFVATIPPSTAYSGSTFDAVSQGIRTLVQSLNDDHVILIDLATYGHTNDSIGYNCGHFSALGYERLAEDYVNYISYVIDENKSTFRQIQFIGTTYSYS